MYSIIAPQDRPRFEALLKEMHKHRHDVVIKQWGWNIPCAADDLEEDQFDTEDTVYIIVQHNETGAVIGSARLNPTTKPHMMSELFSEYCDLQPYPTSKTAWECSRFIIDRKHFDDRIEEFKHRCEIGFGIIEHCLASDIHHLSWLTHQYFYNVAVKVWSTEPLGLPRQGDDGAIWIPAISQIDQETLKRQKLRYENAEEIIAALGAKAPKELKKTRAA